MVDDRNFIHKFDPDASDFENWKYGNNLPDARFYGSLPETRERYRNLKIPSPNWVDVEMGFEVADRLKSGELIAFGILSSPETKDHPERLPTTVFHATDLDINWDQSEVKGLNRTYISVKVCHTSEPLLIPDTPTSEKGRPRLDKLFAEAIDALKTDNPHFEDLPLSTMNMDIRNKVAELHPGRYPGNHRPGETTVRRYLKRRYS